MTHAPRLLYIADVPVEASNGGALLLHRLLRDYPPDRLCIVEATPWESRPDQRLPGVAYHEIPFASQRLLQSRVAPYYNVWLHEKAPFAAQKVDDIADAFAPDAVLTVMHWHVYRTAARVAASRGLPLHLIVHDDMRDVRSIWEPYRSRIDSTMGAAYRQAARRLCVSPYMAEAYEAEWGVPGDVLYPHRGPDSVSFDEPAVRTSSPLTVGYAGALGAPGAQRFCDLADRTSDQIKFLIFSPITPETAREAGINHDRIRYHPFVPANEVVPTLREKTDILLADMRFQSENKPIARYSFPSKLADYSAAGLPIVLWGPAYWSAVRWGQDHSCAQIVTSTDLNDVAESLQDLANHPGRRYQLAKRAIEVGNFFFSHEAAVGAFFDTFRSLPSVTP